MITGINLAVPVPVDYDRAAAVLRSDVLCWLPPAIAGRGAGWTTAVRRGLLHVRVEASVGPPWVTDRRRVARALALDPRAGESGAVGWEPGSWLAKPASGELILDGSDGDVALRFEGRLASRRPLARRVTVAAIRQLLHEIATRMPTAPITAEDDSGARAVSVVRCPVVRPL